MAMLGPKMGTEIQVAIKGTMQSSPLSTFIITELNKLPPPAKVEFTQTWNAISMGLITYLESNTALWSAIGTAIVTHIQTLGEVTTQVNTTVATVTAGIVAPGIVVATAGSPAAQAGASTAPGASTGTGSGPGVGTGYGAPGAAIK